MFESPGIQKMKINKTFNKQFPAAPPSGVALGIGLELGTIKVGVFIVNRSHSNKKTMVFIVNELAMGGRRLGIQKKFSPTP